jgi:hypothetical protein
MEGRRQPDPHYLLIDDPVNLCKNLERNRPMFAFSVAAGFADPIV